MLDTPGGRKIHKNMTPLMGGLPIFLGFILTISIWIPLFYIAEFKFLIAAMILIFVLGMRDDLTVLRARQKLTGQLLVASFLYFFCDVQLTSLYGLLGIYDIPQWASFIVTTFTIIVIINSYNLIDGIDGLAGLIGLTVISFFGIWFFGTGSPHLSYLCFSMAGGIAAFLLFNWAPSKIFMGDTGSSLIGTFIAVCTIYFINRNFLLEPSIFKFNAYIGTAVGLLIIPIMDTIRIFTKRILNGKSPLLPDKNHVHHMLLDMGYKHNKATLILFGINILFITLIIFLKDYSDSLVLTLELACAFIFGTIIELLHTRYMKNNNVDDTKQIYIKKSA